MEVNRYLELVGDDLTAKQFLQLSRKMADDMGKMFLPDMPREDSVAVNIVKYYRNNHSPKMLVLAYYYYLQSLGHKPVLLFDFAKVHWQFLERAENEEKIREDFKRKLENTKKIMEGK